MDIITKRPEGMDFKLYKQLRKSQKEITKKYLKGTLIWNNGTFVGSIRNKFFPRNQRTFNQN